mmetsp:Transcript_22758/g.57897  ORF Transcript_22758/g.57897 Transcript_22758/m.57897 type:complete len:96 (-) Transcript_22758:662-949(-)
MVLGQNEPNFTLAPCLGVALLHTSESMLALLLKLSMLLLKRASFVLLPPVLKEALVALRTKSKQRRLPTRFALGGVGLVFVLGGLVMSCLHWILG